MGTRESSNVSETGSFSIVLLCASGDLAEKKSLFLALFHLYEKGFLPPTEVQIFGYARTEISDDELRDQLREYLIPAKYYSPKQVEDVWDFLNLIKYISGSYDSEEGFRLLDKEISEHEYSKNSGGGSSRRLFYLELPPSVYPFVCNMIKTCCMNKSNLGGWTRIVVEKPFGKDLESAEELSTQIGELFEEPQIYRIGHYLGKELVQKMLVLRFANQLFLSLWNRDNIDNVQIIFKEDFKVEVHGGYFDQYGIIRDIIQNHLLQVLCLVAMERPVSLNPEHIRDERVKVLESVVPISDDEIVLGQYEGYRDDPAVPDESNTPTFASVILRIHNERWEGVPFILRAGKALDSRKKEIRVQFKDVPDDIFKDVPHEILLIFSGQKHRRNGFRICLQPLETIYMKLMYKLGNLNMSTHQSEQELLYWRKEGVTIEDAYENLILDTIRGDQQQFVRRDELEIFTPLLHRIDRGEFKPLPYEAYGYGPKEAFELLRKAGYIKTPIVVKSPGF
ncbi:hypothetical protein HN51_021230 [Arachis hypogaea]|uniref:Glucose-6-phosphate 1-dehydrogenase n=1 Tax=Arachis hypogaea TaxID=3818 RepID=A0A445EHK2_ARAHY|nr:hypothetical protein Ahy_A02g009592 [Arachis hypogaea]